MSIEMIATLILALVTILMTLYAKEVIRMKNREISKLERLRRNDAWEIDFMHWRDKLFRDSKIRVFEYLQKYDHKNLYCFVSNRSNVITISVGYFVGYRCEVLPLGFIIDLPNGIVRDKMTDEEISICK